MVHCPYSMFQGREKFPFVGNKSPHRPMGHIQPLHSSPKNYLLSVMKLLWHSGGSESSHVDFCERRLKAWSFFKSENPFSSVKAIVCLWNSLARGWSNIEPWGLWCGKWVNITFRTWIKVSKSPLSTLMISEGCCLCCKFSKWSNRIGVHQQMVLLPENCFLSWWLKDHFLTHIIIANGPLHARTVAITSHVFSNWNSSYVCLSICSSLTASADFLCNTFD